MKKLILTIALSVALASLAKAEFFITSFGVQLGWDIPHRVQNVVYNDYYGYDIIHANRFNRHGRTFFNLVLQRGNVFIEMRVRHDGFVSRSFISQGYPLFNHVCDVNCGFHSYYYTSYFNHCSSRHHHGHNHVVYNVNRPYVGHRHYNDRNHVSSRSRQVYNRGHHRTTHENRNDRINRNQRSNNNAQPVYSRRSRMHDTRQNTRTRVVSPTRQKTSSRENLRRDNSKSRNSTDKSSRTRSSSSNSSRSRTN